MLIVFEHSQPNLAWSISGRCMFKRRPWFFLPLYLHKQLWWGSSSANFLATPSTFSHVIWHKGTKFCMATKVMKRTVDRVHNVPQQWRRGLGGHLWQSIYFPAAWPSDQVWRDNQTSRAVGCKVGNALSNGVGSCGASCSSQPLMNVHTIWSTTIKFVNITDRGVRNSYALHQTVSIPMNFDGCSNNSDVRFCLHC